MSQNKNADKLTFKALFMEEMRKVEAGSFVADASLKELCSTHSLSLSLADIQNCIRQLELLIGDTYRIRAVRVYKEGYKIYAGEEQYNKASKEGKDKLVSVIKKTSKRIRAVDAEKLPLDLKGAYVHKRMALESLEHIIKGVMVRHNLEVKDVNVLSSAANELKALEHFKKLSS